MRRDWSPALQVLEAAVDTAHATKTLANASVIRCGMCRLRAGLKVVPQTVLMVHVSMVSANAIWAFLVLRVTILLV